MSSKFFEGIKDSDNSSSVNSSSKFDVSKISEISGFTGGVI